MKQQVPVLMTELLEYTRLAPSVHNTQPWRFHIEGSTISLFVAQERMLKAGDPTHRELWISLGACLETLLYAAKGLGFSSTIDSLQTESTSRLIANVRFVQSHNREQALLDLIKNRHSYRGPMIPTVIPPSLLETCRQSTADLSATSVSIIEKKSSISLIGSLTDRGMTLALSSSAFRQELATHIHSNWSHSKTGLHGFALSLGGIASLWEKWSVAFGFDLKRKARADHERILEASGLVCILSKGDVPQFWLEAGRAYMRTSLEITKAGFAQSTITAPIEAADLHEDIEKILHTTDRVQAIIRIGKTVQKKTLTTRFSPRLSVEELLTEP